MVTDVEIQALMLGDDGEVPNNPRLPVLIYKRAISGAAGDELAARIEQRFHANQWSDSWRNGVFTYHHYHSGTHEVLGVYSGHATLQLGGNSGVTVEVHAGDVAILPAGTGHKNLGCSNDFRVVGAYPDGRSPDLCCGEADERPAADANIAKVPLPTMDPTFGAEGPLFQHWGE